MTKLFARKRDLGPFRQNDPPPPIRLLCFNIGTAPTHTENEKNRSLRGLADGAETGEKTATRAQVINYIYTHTHKSPGTWPNGTRATQVNVYNVHLTHRRGHKFRAIFDLATAAAVVVTSDEGRRRPPLPRRGACYGGVWVGVGVAEQ